MKGGDRSSRRGADATMDDRQFIEAHIKALEESVRAFASDKKGEREVWVASTFLSNLGVAFDPAEVRESGDDPPDVLFRDARFEIKEIMEPGRKRHLEFKEELERARKATSVQDLFRPFEGRDTTLQAIYDLCLAQVAALETKYAPSVRSGLDLLFYINLHEVFGVVEQSWPSVVAVSQAGWRSVSFLEGHLACCLSAGAGAPRFLIDAVGTIRHRRAGAGGI